MDSRAQVAPRAARHTLRGATGALPSKGAFGTNLYMQKNPALGRASSAALTSLRHRALS